MSFLGKQPSRLLWARYGVPGWQRAAGNMDSSSMLDFRLRGKDTLG